MSRIHQSPKSAVDEAMGRLIPNVDTGATPELMELLLEHGRRFIPAPLPSDIQRMSPGMCFDASIVNALQSDGKYGYVEGVALDPDNQRYWVLHGWMTDGEYAFDPTWLAIDDSDREYGLPTIYLGIQMDVKAVAKFMKATSYQCVLSNRWRNPKLADTAIFSQSVNLVDKRGTLE